MACGKTYTGQLCLVCLLPRRPCCAELRQSRLSGMRFRLARPATYFAAACAEGALRAALAWVTSTVAAAGRGQECPIPRFLNAGCRRTLCSDEEGE